jgi:hypothetical protein
MTDQFRPMTLPTGWAVQTKRGSKRPKPPTRRPKWCCWKIALAYERLAQILAKPQHWCGGRGAFCSARCGALAEWWQMGELYLPAVRSDKEECIVTHQDILWAVAPGRPGLQKKDARASGYVQQGYRRCRC